MKLFIHKIISPKGLMSLSILLLALVCGAYWLVEDSNFQGKEKIDHAESIQKVNHSVNKINKSENLVELPLTNKSLDPIEQKKAKWASYLASHKYYNRKGISYSEWKGIPKTDRPDLAMELDFLKTVDPNLGVVPYERLEKAASIMNATLNEKAAISGVTWEERGANNVGGRTRAIMFDPNDTDNKKVWAGGVGGGLWYTNDITVAEPLWVKVNDFWDNIAITTIAYNPANTQEFYVGTGEGFGNGDAQRGGGIWKTTDGGTTWSRLTATNPGAYNSGSHFHYVQKIIVKDNGTIFAATKGYYINNGGVMRSTDGGSTWSRVHSVYSTLGGSNYDWVADIEKASNGDLYCSFGIGSSSSVYKSTNANNGASGTWTNLSTNISVGAATRIEMACAPSNQNVIYAVAAGGAGSMDVLWFKKSTDAGTTWSNLTIPVMVDGSGDHFTRGQAWYDLILGVHPTNENIVLAGGIDLHRSLNGGSTWTGISHWYGGFSKPEVHADQHNMAFRPGNVNQVLFSHDGGLTLSLNAGNSTETPSFADVDNGYNITQLYACAMENQANSHYFLSGLQDNGSQQYTQPQINSSTEVTGGDGGFCHIDQLNSAIQTTSYTYNSIYRSLDGGSTFPTLINETTGHFINPSEYDSERKILYAAADNDRLKRISNMGGAITNSTLTISVGTSKVSTLKISPYNDVLFLGIANGRIYKYTNASTGTPTLTRIDNGSTPISSTGWVSSVDVGANDNHILVTYSNYGVVSVWETTDGGTTWYNKEGNLPDMPIRWAIYNPDNRNQVLAATELGVWSTDNFQPGVNAAPTWGATVTGLAHTRCDMLKYRTADKLVAVATHGRGLFTTDIFATTSIADFNYTESMSCSGSLTVNFIDASLRANDSWAWDINDDGVVDYTTRNPTHTYTQAGLYSVTLTINSGASTITKTEIIYVANSAPTASTGCTVSANSNLSNGFGIGIYHFELEGIDYRTSNNDGHYQDYTCSDFTPLNLNTSYELKVETGTANNEGVRFYIDYNDNGIFEAGESIASLGTGIGVRTVNFTTPASGVVLNKGLRMRVLSRYNATPTGPCDVSTYGQAEDYTVYFPDPLALSATLLSFEAECDKRQKELKWITVSESNNDYFIVERSVDGKLFEQIGTVASKEKSILPNSYSFVDEDNSRGTVYYKLKQRDYDGTTTTLETITVNCSDEKDEAFVVYPNPTKGVFFVESEELITGLSVLSANGILIYKSAPQEKKTMVDLSNAPSGVYVLCIENSIGKEIKKIVMQ